MIPPLLGDGGVYRVHIVGNAGVGKSTTGRQLAEILGVPFISLDTLHWKPGWTQATTAEFREKVENALAAAPNGWVVDGNYTAKLQDIVHARSTDRIWLDPPLLLYLPRLVLRTLLRALGLQEDCSPGCREQLSRAFFSKDSIILWCISGHQRIRKRERALFARIGLGLHGPKPSSDFSDPAQACLRACKGGETSGITSTSVRRVSARTSPFTSVALPLNFTSFPTFASCTLRPFHSPVPSPSYPPYSSLWSPLSPERNLVIVRGLDYQRRARRNASPPLRFTRH
uniref:ATPase AAA-type core domain-containing protein n=1 Tax=Mycena chlorophos TaxID=658473 RepID=A0ABQ0LJW8_MYCCL|nr:predicted protein [Mycena chlorophos]